MTERLKRGVLLRTLRDVWRADRRGAIVAAALQFVGVVAALALVGSSKLAFEGILTSGSTVSAPLVVGLVGLAVATALTSSIGVIQGQQQRLLGERLAQSSWRALLATTSNVPLMTWEDTAWIERLERIRGNALQRPVVVVTSLFSLLGGLASGAALGVVLIAIHPLLLPTFLVAGLPALMIGRVAARSEFVFARDSGRLAMRRNYIKRVLTERAAAAELRVLAAARFLLERHAADDGRYLAVLAGQVRKRQVLGLASATSSALALALTLLLIVSLVVEGAITLADAGAGAIAARILGSQVAVVFASLGTFAESAPFLRDMHSFTSTRPDGHEEGRQRELTGALELLDVSFSYPGTRRPALTDVSVCLASGQVVAVVGENGSGKTTLAKIVAGLYEPTAGTVTWDGADGLSLSELRQGVSLLPQNFLRLQMSVRENITIGDPDHADDHERVIAVSRDVGLDSALSELPQGYDTELGIELSEGADLSGGQWQRLALARALFRDRAVLVMDEPTAALDPRAEYELFADVRRILGGRTALFITHRFSSARLADVIYVMRDGSVVEHGTHADLVAAGGLYAELYSLQASAFDDD